MLDNIGMCLDPDDPELLHAPGAFEKHIWSKSDRMSQPTMVDGWQNPPFGKQWMMKHMMVGLVRDDDKYPVSPPPGWFESDRPASLDSECFQFNYDDETARDPAGCRPFKKSFQPLQKLRTCIVDNLNADELWSQRKHRTLTDEKGKNQTYDDWCREAIWGYTSPGKLPIQLCMPFESNTRAEEMIKFVLFKKPLRKTAEIVEHVKKKILFTVTWPKDQSGLMPDTVSSIQRGCFGVPDHSGHDRGGELSVVSRFASLQKLGVCLPLMFDKVEIIGFGLGNGIPKFQSPDFYGKNLVQARFPQTSSLCGRLALSMIPNYQTAKYTLLNWGTLRFDQKHRWKTCVDASSTNCRQVYFCWESALNRMCGLDHHCCPGRDEEERRDVQSECARNPDGQILRSLHALTLGLRLLPESIAHWHCPSQMGTDDRMLPADSDFDSIDDEDEESLEPWEMFGA